MMKSDLLFQTDLNISEVEALEILKAASHSSRLDTSGGDHAILTGNSIVFFKHYA